MPSPEFATCKVCRLPIAELQQTINRRCPFCDRLFLRVDATRRHAKTCHERANRPLREAKRGRKSRACNICSRDKTSCNGALPCLRCSTRKLECTYSSLCRDASHREIASDTGNGLSRMAERDERMDMSLLEWSDPCRDPMLKMLESEPRSAIEYQPQKAIMPGLPAWLEGTIDPALLLLDLPADDASWGSGEGLVENGDPVAKLSIAAAAKRMQTLEATFRKMLVLKPYLQTGFDAACGNSFFDKSHVERVLSAGARRSSQLATFIHWPTFDPEKISLPLLLAIVLVKTAYLHYSGDNQASILNTLFLEMVEEYIFQQLRELIDQLASHPENIKSKGPAFDACGAAEVIIAIQCTINNPRARERIATERIPYLVNILRKSEMIGTRHTTSLDAVSWGDFAHTEAQIRLVTSLHNSCGLLSGFCNHPSPFTVKEMKGSLPCNNDIWHAKSQSDFEELQRMLPTGHTLPSFHQAISILQADDWDLSKHPLGELGIQQLFLVVIGEPPSFHPPTLYLTMLQAFKASHSTFVPSSCAIPRNPCFCVF